MTAEFNLSEARSDIPRLEHEARQLAMFLVGQDRFDLANGEYRAAYARLVKIVTEIAARRAAEARIAASVDAAKAAAAAAEAREAEERRIAAERKEADLSYRDYVKHQQSDARFLMERMGTRR